MKTEVRKDEGELLRDGRGRLEGEIEQSKSEGRGVVLMVSGGSALGLLEGNESLLENGDLICVLDERFSDDPLVNNFKQLEKLEFYQKSLERGAASIATLAGRGTVEDLAREFEESLRDWLGENKGAKVIATLGMGADGHTAGIGVMADDPGRFAELFVLNERWVAGYSGSLMPPLRVTVTVGFLVDKVEVGVGVVAGEEKREAFLRVKSASGRLAETPARIWREMKEVVVFTNLD